jgi:hypothetical protein
MADRISSVEAEFTLLKSAFKGTRQRRSKRYRCALATLGRVFLPDGSSVDAWAHNLSDNGIGLTMEQSLEVGTLIQIRLRGTDASLTVSLRARVAHATADLDGSWRVGCEFERSLSPDELDCLL